MNEALQTICSIEDQAFLEWSDLKFRLGYKYDLSIMLDDIVTMVLEVNPRRQAHTRWIGPHQGSLIIGRCSGMEMRWRSSRVRGASPEQRI
ncbi:uncharacterized protein STAUR_0361 [Stigmatella aurantiaca DW4/3-1]|uniref:Uncharacterized protein n=1 Tax=Stigmatella aurantiaca (strain DW4/3-1) TaxID=378806 RepID=E3FQ60_STIAD|nr:uncharacterized protein STAUR_0361 [Stigmatella aurantiaca DW4/3-1]